MAYMFNNHICLFIVSSKMVLLVKQPQQSKDFSKKYLQKI